MQSYNNTVLSLPGQSISDANGNCWSIIGGRVSVNGIVDPTTSGVIEMAYENGLVWQKNAANLWWSKATPSAAWYPPHGTPVSPVHAVTHVWNGSNDAFATPGDWTPGGVPQAGDTAVVGSGVVAVGAGGASGVNFLLQGGEVDIQTGGSYAIGTLRGAGVMVLGYPGQSAMVTTTGITVAGGTLTIREFVSSNSALIVHGDSSISAGGVFASQLIGTGSLPRGPLENDGAMTVDAATLTVGALTGSGVIRVTGNGTVSVDTAAAGETIQLQSGHLAVGGGPIPTGTAMQFLAPVTNFGAGSEITLNATQATREVFAKSAPTAGELFLYNGSQLVADLHISGQARIYATNTPAGALPGSVTLTAYDTGHAVHIASR